MGEVQFVSVGEEVGAKVLVSVSNLRFPGCFLLLGGVLLIKILSSILTIFGAENCAKMTILGANFMQWPNLLH